MLKPTLARSIEKAVNSSARLDISFPSLKSCLCFLIMLETLEFSVEAV